MSYVMSSQQAKLVLGRFQCPFSSPVSSFSSCNLNDTIGCVFGHQNGVIESSFPCGPAPSPSGAALSSIPPYICVDHLLNRCVLPVMFSKLGLQSCELGFHATIENLDRFQCKIASSLLSTTHHGTSKTIATTSCPGSQESVLKQDETLSTLSSRHLASNAIPSQVQREDHQCGVCFEQILESNRNFGLLEQCAHLFCANCIAEWKERSPGPVLTCPLCRAAISRVMIWPSLITYPDEKKSIMDLQERCSKEKTADESSENGEANGMEAVEEEVVERSRITVYLHNSREQFQEQIQILRDLRLHSTSGSTGRFFDQFDDRDLDD